MDKTTILKENVCNSCPRQCNINRNIKKGFCNEKRSIRIAKIIKNFEWEEPCITGQKGCLAIFFSGCNLRCDYCQNYQISRGEVGKEYSIQEFQDMLKENQENHSSIDLITPTHFSEQLIEVFSSFKPKIPVVWNTNGYETIENIKKVSKFVDVFLTDFKYSNNSLGEKFSICKDYYTQTLPAIKEMCKQKPDKFEGDFMTQGVVIRHLVLPGFTENSLQVLDDIKQYFPSRKISIMSQFTPNGKSELNRKLKPIEYKTVISHLEKLGLENGYLQEFESANNCFVPKFD